MPVRLILDSLRSLGFAQGTRLVQAANQIHANMSGGLPRVNDERSEERVEWTVGDSNS